MSFPGGNFPLGRFSLSLLLAIAFSSPYRVFAGQSIESVRVDFQKVKCEGGTVEKLSGTIFHRSPDWILIQVKNPVAQWMLLTGSQMLLYYPITRRAYMISHSRRNLQMPFYLAFLSAGKEDFGLSQNGYKMTKYELSEERLISTWSPPKELQNALGDMSLEYLAGKLIAVRVFDPDDGLINEIRFSDHLFLGAVSLPMKIIIKKKKHPDFSDEISFANFSFNTPLPKDIVDFQVPKDVPVKKITW